MSAPPFPVALEACSLIEERYNGSTETMVGPRFEQTAEAYQPRPLAAIELIQEEPIRMVHARRAVCDGGEL